MEKHVRMMMDLIASEVCGKKLNLSEYEFTDDELIKLYELSKAHDLAHLVAFALIKNEIVRDDEIKVKFEEQIMLAVYRYEKMNYELNRLRSVLNEERIPFIPLKGSVLRKVYPEPWMRTSGDIDILVHDEQVDYVAKTIAYKLEYGVKRNNYHDISLMSDSGVHLELHHSIKENQQSIDAQLSKCWEHAAIYDRYEYSFTNEFFFFHQLAHAAHHFLHGGCGVRPFLDMYLLERKMSFDREGLYIMLEKSGMKKFFNAAKALSEVWFGSGQHDDITRRMEQFILVGGVYGSVENLIAVSQQKEKGRLGYIINRLWLPYELLCATYPRLQGRKYLQLFYEIKRWFCVFDPEARKRKRRDLNAIKGLGDEKKANVNQMLKDLELINFKT